MTFKCFISVNAIAIAMFAYLKKMDKIDAEIIVDEEGTRKVAIPVQAWERLQADFNDLREKVELLESAGILADRMDNFVGVPMRDALESLRSKLQIPLDA